MPILYAQRLRLRASEREDIPLFLKWVNDPEVCEYLEHFTVLNRIHEEAWFENVSSGPRTELPLVIEVSQPNSDEWVPIGDLSFMNIHSVHRSAEIGIMIGEKEYWNKGYGTETMRVMCRYGFEELNLNRVWLRVYDTNPRARKAYEKAGFVYEGTLRQAEYKHGRYIDVHVMSVLKSDWTKS